MMSYIGKILIIVENLPVPVDTRVWQEANTLAEAGYKISIICPKGKECEKSYEVINNISIYRHPIPVEGNDLPGYIIEYSAALFWEIILAFKVFFAEGFDVIHACNPPDNIFLIGAIFKLFGKKFVFDHHDINPELYMAKFKKKGIFHRILLIFEKFTFKVADISIATNESFKNIAIHRNQMPHEKIFIVRNGPCFKRLKIYPPINELKKGKKYLISYIGVIGQQDGLDYLLDAARYIRDIKGRDDIFYAILGDGPYLLKLKEKCSSYNLDDIFEFKGMLYGDNMLNYLNTADICVSPDEFNEMNDKSTMNKIMEYMALGKPIVQFDMKEGKYSAGEASLYAKPNDSMDFAKKILFLLDNEELRIKMGQFGRKRVDNELKWDKTKLNLIKAYDALFNYKREE